MGTEFRGADCCSYLGCLVVDWIRRYRNGEGSEVSAGSHFVDEEVENGMRRAGN